MRYNNIDEVALLFKRLLSTEDGLAFIDVLENRFQNQPIIPVQVTDGAAMIPLTFTRIGEDNVVRYIKSLVKREIGKAQDD